MQRIICHNSQLLEEATHLQRSLMHQAFQKMRALDTCRQCGVFKRGLVVIVYYDEVGSVGQAIGCFWGEMHQLPLQRLWVEKYPSIFASQCLN